ncbi:MAG: SGNH/GDSL hydrolase family protein [Phycisphaerae bacterium]|nr:SGNH/GDSL hydrolase family protein [Phycisphaerae bacterium]
MGNTYATNSGPPDADRRKGAPQRRTLSRRKKAFFTLVVFGSLFLIPETLTRIIAPEYAHLRFGPGLTSGYAIGQRGANHGYEKALEPKQPGEVRIAMLGDSVMWGFGLPIEQSIPARVEARLAAVRPHVSWRCINLAGMGTTPGLRKDFVLQNMDDWHADAIIVQFNLNDVGWDDHEYAQRQIDATPGVAGLFSNGAIRLRQRYLRLSAFLALIEEQCKQAIVQARPPRDPEKIGLAANCDSAKIRARW